MFAILCLVLTEIPIWNNGSDQIQRWTSPLQKIRDERVNTGTVIDSNAHCRVYFLIARAYFI